MKWILLFSVLLGSTSFFLDAFFAHGLRSYLGENYNDAIHHALTTAARYQLVAAILLLVLLLLFRSIPSNWIILSAIFVIFASFAFCGTIYLKHLFGITSLRVLAPLGGISFALAFLALLPLVMAL